MFLLNGSKMEVFLVDVGGEPDHEILKSFSRIPR
jgi:hypothetical protein